MAKQRCSTCSRTGARQCGALLLVMARCLLQKQVLGLGAESACLEHGELVDFARNLFIVVVLHRYLETDDKFNTYK